MLVCVFPDMKEEILKNYLINVALLAKQFDVDVHFLNSGGAETLHTLVGKIPHGELQALKMASHPITADWPPGIVGDTVKRYRCDLIVLPYDLLAIAASARLSHNSDFGARVREYVLEQTATPIMLLSNKTDLQKTAIKSVLVPMSGEIRVSSALKFGLRLAKRIHVPVDLVHVVIENSRTNSPLEALGDQPHHEYRELLDRILAAASPFSDVRERARVRMLYEVQGLPATEIMKMAKKTPSCAIVAEWHGSLIHGKAETLKDLLQESDMPIFLVKAEADQKSILKIGTETRVA